MNDTDSISENPLLKTLRIRVPGETFRLPSQGLFYNDGELSDEVKQGEVHVYPLTAIDEVTLKSPDTLMSGSAIETVFRRCVPQVLKPLKLLAKDVDYLMMCMRLLSYGPQMSIAYSHHCDNAKEHTYNIELRPLIQKSVPIDPTTIGSNYQIVLDNGQVVKMKPTVFDSMLAMYQSIAFDNVHEKDPATMQKRLNKAVAEMIISVDEIKNQDQIYEWLCAIPSGYLVQLSTAAEQISHWGPDLTTEVACGDCGQSITLDIPINPINFFM